MTINVHALDAYERNLLRWHLGAGGSRADEVFANADCDKLVPNWQELVETMARERGHLPPAGRARA